MRNYDVINHTDKTKQSTSVLCLLFLTEQNSYLQVQFSSYLNHKFVAHLSTCTGPLSSSSVSMISAETW